MADSVGSESVYGVSDELADPFCDLCCQEGTIRRAAGYCPKCIEFYCWNCLAGHRRMAATASHKILQGSDMPACQADKPVKYQLCDKHDGEDKDRYCFDHGITICGICNRKEHKRCQVEAVSVALKEFDMSAEKTSLSADVGLLLKHLKDTSQSITSNKARLEIKGKDILTAAQKERDKLLEKVNQSYHDFSAEVTSLFKDHITTLSARQSALDEIAIKVDSMLQGLQQSGQTKHNDQTEFLELYYYAEKVRLLEDKIKLLNLKQIDIHCTLTTNTQPLFVTKHKFGELSLQLAASQYSTELPRVHLPFTGRRQDPQKTVPGSGAISGHAVQSVRLAPLQKIKVKITDDKQDCFITGADFTVDGNILLADLDNRKVKLFSHEGKLLSFLKLQDAAKQVAVINKSEAAASMQKKQIGIIDIADSGHLNLKRIIITQQYVFGITTYNNNLIVTCGISSDRRRSIQMIDMREKVHWTTKKDSKGKNMFRCADYLTTCFSDDGNSVIVTDKKKQKITVLDAGTGNVIKVYDVKGNKPLGVTVDNKRNVYVCYESGEITVWSNGMQGETLQTAERKCLKFPLAMACNRRRSELVLTSSATFTDYSDFVHRFKIAAV